MNSEISLNCDDYIKSDKKGFSGAMDVVVVKWADGQLAGSPFFVQFGKFKIYSTERKLVDIVINGRRTNVKMELNANGVCKFLRNAKDRTLTVSPLKAQEDKEDEEAIQNKIEEEKIGATHKRRNSGDQILDDLSDASFSEVQGENVLNYDELRDLQLKDGINIVHYVVHGSKHVLAGKIYLWNYDAKIVITDIDGTLTKSDLIGILSNYFGIDWTRGGVVYFYNLLLNRGYKIMFLSARSLAQLESTRDYLAGIKQDGSYLPDGPLLLNPSGLWKSLINEVSKKSKIFKENILREILNLFPPGLFPFYSGIGNREGDAIAYKQIGISPEYIFIINKKGKEKGEFVSIKNFKDRAMRIDLIFPDLNIT